MSHVCDGAPKDPYVAEYWICRCGAIYRFGLASWRRVGWLTRRRPLLSLLHRPAHKETPT